MKTLSKSQLAEPTIAMCDFFALPEVKAEQLIQSRNPYNSEAHRKASETMRALARQYGAEKFFGEY